MPSYPERLLTDDEEIVAELRPHWRVLLAPAFWTVLCIGAIVAALVADPEQTWVLPAVALLSLVFFVGLAVPPAVRRWFTLYVLTTERIVVRTGVVSRTGHEIPLESISNVLFSQSVVERLLGYGDVLLESAGETSQTRLRDVPDPEDFQSMVYDVRERRSLHFARGAGSAAPRDTAAQLTELAALRDSGDLTQEEYEAEKAKLLGEG